MGSYCILSLAVKLLNNSCKNEISCFVPYPFTGLGIGNELSGQTW